MIPINSKMPDGELQERKNGEVITHNTRVFFANKKIVLFAVPGAFTPTCSAAHLPGYVINADNFKEKGVDEIVCLSVNDAFVMEAWGINQNAAYITMLADGDGSYSQALGLTMETGAFGGLRSLRYAMIIDNGVVTHLNVDKPKTFESTKAEVMLSLL